MPPDYTVPETENAERILREGWTLFQAKGYHGVAIDELCHRCGITKPTLYYYFHDKENLYVQVLMHRMRGFRAVIESGAPLPDRLYSVALTMIESFETGLMAMMRDVAHIQNAGLRRFVEQGFHAELLGPLTELARSGIDRGELAKGDPSFLAWAFLGLVSTFVTKERALGFDQPALAHRVVTLFLKGAGEPSAAPRARNQRGRS